MAAHVITVRYKSQVSLPYMLCLQSSGLKRLSCVTRNWSSCQLS